MGALPQAPEAALLGDRPADEACWASAGAKPSISVRVVLAVVRAWAAVLKFVAGRCVVTVPLQCAQSLLQFRYSSWGQSPYSPVTPVRLGFSEPSCRCQCFDMTDRGRTIPDGAGAIDLNIPQADDRLVPTLLNPNE